MHHYLGFTYITVSVVLCYCLPEETQTVKRSKQFLYLRKGSVTITAPMELCFFCKVNFLLLLYTLETVPNFQPETS